ncbi:MAG TPA: phosphoglucosamine mutase [Alphaproteobacteria bacterium]|nr:phosphoglucosamine mutase [Alphaproteobacteria bacterium]
MAVRKLFGTDGVRGKANQYPMTAEIALKLGIAAGSLFKRGDHRRQVVIGKDTRLSGYMIETALTAGFTAVGMDVLLLGPMPTPAVAMLTRSMRADLGVVISASHNPYEDNGIKFFGPDGYKLSDEMELETEERVFGDTKDCLAPSSQIGQARRLDDAVGRYIEYAKNTFPRGKRLDGLKVVLDCANGASYRVAPTVLYELGAEVVAISVDPDGRNINADCGALHTDKMCEQVVKQGADIGIALDGDADRLIVCDEKGQVIDGDQILALVSREWKESGILKGNGVVTTVMSNLGLERYLKANGMNHIRTQVGDRYVVERMRADGYNLGGEQSGHLILGEHSTTGDGLVAALQVCAAVVKERKPVSQVMHLFEPVPQLLKNVRLSDRALARAALVSDPVKIAIDKTERALGDNGRLLIRPSGTEPLIRIMLEGEDQAQIAAMAEEIAQALIGEVKALEAHL